MDTGPVYLQHECAISEDETVEKLHDKLAIMGSYALIECLQLLSQDLLPKPMIQDESQVTYAHKLKKIESQLSWNESAQDIARKIRALVPWPGVTAEISGQPYKLWQAEFISQNSNCAVGEISKADKNTLHIQCKEGQLKILSLQKSGKKRMDIRQFMPARTDWFK